MGMIQALSMAEMVEDGAASLSLALTWHLRSNHYPPLPLDMVAVAEEAVIRANAGDWEDTLALPEGITYRGDHLVIVADLIESLHLAAFLEEEV